MQKKIFQKTRKLISVIAGMSGYRIDRLFASDRRKYLTLMIIWAVGIVVSLTVAWITARHFFGAIIYFSIAWAFYFIGNTIILTTPLHLKAIKRFGEERAYRCYEVIVGLMFANQAFAFGAIVEENWFRWPWFARHGIIDEAGLFLIGAGFIVKIWATMIVGLDIYYYKDMFLRKTTGTFAVTGPYKFFNNPMYGLGNLQIYGIALFHFSISGLAAAAIYQLSIYIFYFVAERPVVRKLYGKTVFYNGLKSKELNCPEQDSSVKIKIKNREEGHKAAGTNNIY